MFSFPLEKMVGGIFYEHGHRLIASAVGFLTIVLAVWTWRVEPRALGALARRSARWRRHPPGLLGGLTVLFLLPAPISIGHAGLAQIFFCITVSLALFTSRGWLAPATPLPDDPTLARLTFATTRADLRADSARRDDAAYVRRGWRFRTSRWRSDASCRRVWSVAHRGALRASRRCGGRDRRDDRGDGRARLAPSPDALALTRSGRPDARSGGGAGDARGVRRALRAAPDRQHRARRQRRAAPCDVAGAHARAAAGRR